MEAILDTDLLLYNPDTEINPSNVQNFLADFTLLASSIAVDDNYEETSHISQMFKQGSSPSSPPLIRLLDRVSPPLEKILEDGSDMKSPLDLRERSSV